MRRVGLLGHPGIVAGAYNAQAMAPRLTSRLAASILTAAFIGACAAASNCGGTKPLEPGTRLFIADVETATGDLAFDTVIRQVILTSLQQTPHFWVTTDLSRQRALSALQQRPDQPVTGDRAREVCTRVGARVAVATTLAEASTGVSGTVGIVDCQTGQSIASAPVAAASRDETPGAVAAAVTGLRRAMGEPADSIAKYQTPVATSLTGSMDGLRAFALGNRARVTVNDLAAAPFFERAVSLDASFATAWLRLGVVSSTTGHVGAARAAAAKAFELRERATEYDRRYIVWNHAARVLRDDKATREALEQLVATYPYDFGARNNMGVYHVGRGEFEQALTHYRAAAAVAPDEPVPALNIAYTLLFLGQRDEAYKTLAAVLTTRPDGGLAVTRWQSAVFTGDARASDFEQAATTLASPAQMMGARATIAAWEGRTADYLAAEVELRRQAVAAKNDSLVGGIDASVALTRAALEQGAALTALRDFVRPETTPPAVIAQSAALLAALGRLDLARPLLARVEMLAEESQAVYLPVIVTRSYVQAADGQAKQAAALIETTLVEFPQSLDLNYHLGRMREAAGDRAGAIAAYQTVVQAQPVLGHNPAILPARARLQAMKGS